MECFLSLLLYDMEVVFVFVCWYDVWVCELYLQIDCKWLLCYVVEVWYDSFVDLVFVKLLCCYKVVFVVLDLIEVWLQFEDLSVWFVYLWLYGIEMKYLGEYVDVVFE